MTAPVRITAVLTHPIQYYGAWFRQIHAEVPGIELTVVYAVEPSADQQGVGFGQSFTWDIPPREGYRSIVARPSRPGDAIGTGSFFGVDAPSIGQTVLSTTPDVVVVFGWYSISLLRAARAARRAGIPVLWRGDTNLTAAPRGARRWLWHARTRWLLRQFDGFLSVGTRTDAYLRYFGIPDSRIERAPHAVDAGLFAPAVAARSDPATRAALRQRLGVPPDAWVACFVGKLEANKRPMDVIRAAARAGEVTVLVAGTGALEPDCRAEAQRLGVRVVWCGFVNQRRMPDIYAAADVLVLTSERETWGLVINEAFATGLPCIVSDSVGAAPDLMPDGCTGARVASGDVDQLAEALRGIRNRQRSGEDFSALCLTVSEHFSFAAASAGLVRLAQMMRGGDMTSSPQHRVVVLCGTMVFIGGLELMTFEIIRMLREQGTAVHCIVNGWDNRRLVAAADAAGASWTTGYYWHRIQLPTSPREVWNMVHETIRTSAGLIKDAWRFRATHVFAPEPYAVLRNLPAFVLLRLFGVRSILRVGVGAPDSTAFRRTLRRLVAPMVDLIICNSHYTAGTLEAAGIDGSRLRVIHNTVPARALLRGGFAGGVSAVPTPPIRGRVVYVGQIIPVKGLDRLIEAVAQLRRWGVDATLDIVGDMDDWVPPDYAIFRDALARRASDPDLAGAVRFLGWQQDPTCTLAHAEVHCCPSRIEQREGFGLVVLEAKAAGVPSVVTPSGALPEIVEHGRDGWVCRDDSVEAIAEGLAVFLRNAERRDAAAARAGESTDKFTRRQFVEQWTQVFAR
jgi:glycosyltransferase involved in cell wall biosynthesis